MTPDFTATKILWLCLRPSMVIALAGLIGVVLGWTRFRRTGRFLAAAALLSFPVILLLPIHQWLLLPLEARFPPPGPIGHVDGIVLLGGAVDPYLTHEHDMPALNEAAERMTTFVALARRHPEAQLAFSGGSGTLASVAETESDVAARLFRDLGLERPVTYDPLSRTTFENAQLLREKVRPRPGETWLLVTSASHMPRAVGSFRQAGWTVTAWPVGYKVGRRAEFNLEQGLPERLGGIDMAFHEWVGLLAYRALGRSNAVFPHP